MAIKIARVIGVLNKLKHIIPQHILLTIYNSLIQPHLIYGLYLWGLNCKRLRILQKKAVRILAFRPYISHSTSIFKTLKIRKLEDLYTMQLYKFYYKNTNNLLPSYFNSFTPYYNNENHNHDLRHRILRVPMTRHEYYVQCTKYQLLRLIRETPHIDLNRCTQLNIVQFLAYFKYSFINNYNPVLQVTTLSCLWFTDIHTLWYKFLSRWSCQIIIVDFYHLTRDISSTLHTIF